MPRSCFLYYITDRAAFPGDEPARQRRLLEKIAEATAANIDYIQLREKDLTIRDLESLAREAASVIHKLRTENRELRTKFLINSRTDVALAVAAGGVHLPANDVLPQDVRAAWRLCGAGTHPRDLCQPPQISVSCHSPEEVTQAAANAATLALFAPVFEKKDALRTTPQGIEGLRQACRVNIPVVALGGIALRNARSCLQAGAAGIAAIRLFQENDIATVARTLRDCWTAAFDP
jgi:thiamine-phosphate pyrophosphorylase